MSNKVDEIREQMGKLHKKYNPFTDFNFKNDLSIEEYVYSLGDWFKGLLDQFKSLEDKTNEAIDIMTENLIPGPPNILTIGTVESGETASASITGTSPEQVLNLVLPQGPQGIQGVQGPQGATGPANVLTIGTVGSGSTASATITGTSPSQVLNLILPKGDKGDPGSGGTEIKTLDVTVTLDSGMGGYTGFISSTLPAGIENEIDEILKIEKITIDSGMTNRQALPIYTFSASDFKFQNSFTFQKVDGLPAEYASMIPLGLVFTYIATVAEGNTVTYNLRITYSTNQTATEVS